MLWIQSTYLGNRFSALRPWVVVNIARNIVLNFVVVVLDLKFRTEMLSRVAMFSSCLDTFFSL